MNTFKSLYLETEEYHMLIHQDLRAWVTVIHHSVLDSVEVLMEKLVQDTRLIQRGSKGVLEIW